ncbi:hypothetical protein QNJ24_07975 [Macrococcus caseolyticus]|uniref:hypothetical protein n=1 Tax=Macrococcoides caseolyticum TaxID=69966 RepID=UPI0024BCA0D9|nr:hypothetical protein [Macrococcus caseolyticus]MDJ1156047.1 hypothetical protein [Macrococcus caseolyticus]
MGRIYECDIIMGSGRKFKMIDEIQIGEYVGYLSDDDVYNHFIKQFERTFVAAVDEENEQHAISTANIESFQINGPLLNTNSYEFEELDTDLKSL